MDVKKLLLSCTIIFAFSFPAICQEKWDLRKCVEYAIANNITIKQADIDARTANLTYAQSMAAQLGQASFNTSMGFQFGRSIDRTTNFYTNNQSLFQSYNLQAGATLFNWFSLKRAVESNKYYYQAQKENVFKVQNDVTLNVAAGYLQALLAREQVSIGETKLNLTRAQLDITRRRVDAGALPELNAAEIEAQLANDSSAVISAKQTYQINVLQLKALLNLDAAAPFDLDTPPVEKIPIDPIAELQPDLVYGLAVKAFPQQRVNDLKILAAQKNASSIHGQLYPTLSIFGNLGTNFSNELRRIDQVSTGAEPTQLYTVDGSGNQFFVYSPSVKTTYSKQPFGKVFSPYWSQFNNNFGQNIGLQLSVPIFNGLLTRTNYKKALLNVESLNLQKQSDLLTLKQNIYQAYYNAVAALEKFNANKVSVSTAQRSFDLATKRYDIGMLASIDYITNQNNLFTAQLNLVSAQYDYVFKMKVLEFYKGMGIKL